MAWVTPSDVNAGDAILASKWNQDVVENSTVLRSYQNRFASFFRTAGSYTLNNTSWSALDTTSDLTVSAAASDVIEAGIYGLFGSTGPLTYIDVVTRASGSNVTSFGGRAAAPSGNVTGYYMPGAYAPAGGEVAFGAMAHLTLGASDVASGNVTCRVQFRTTSASNRTLYGSAADVFYFYIKNLGPVTT